VCSAQSHQSCQLGESHCRPDGPAESRPAPSALAHVSQIVCSSVVALRAIVVFHGPRVSWQKTMQSLEASATHWDFFLFGTFSNIVLRDCGADRKTALQWRCASGLNSVGNPGCFVITKHSAENSLLCGRRLAARRTPSRESQDRLITTLFLARCLLAKLAELGRTSSRRCGLYGNVREENRSPDPVDRRGGASIGLSGKQMGKKRTHDFRKAITVFRVGLSQMRGCAATVFAKQRIQQQHITNVLVLQ
jgi:hypothetical protein